MSRATCSPELTLTAADLAEIEAALGGIAIQGDRYPARLMAMVGL